MKKYQGQSLIELVIFIVVVGIITGAIVNTFRTILIYSYRPGSLLTASQLADARMNIIIQQRRVNGFTNISDPCSTSSLAACTGLNTFANNYGYIINSSLPAAVNGTRIVTVTVSGTGNATSVVRFVQ